MEMMKIIAQNGIETAKMNREMAFMKLQFEKITELEKKMFEMNSKYVELKLKFNTEIVNQKDRMKRIEQLERDLKFQENKVSDFENSTTNQISDLAKQFEEISSVSIVKFSAAYCCADISANPGPFKFNDVTINDGGGYDGFTGLFTCPKASVYFFIANLEKMKETAYMYIYHRPKGSSSAQKKLYVVSQESYHMQLIGSIMLDLAEGDQVYVQLRGTIRGETIGDRRSFFHGFLIQ